MRKLLLPILILSLSFLSQTVLADDVDFGVDVTSPPTWELQTLTLGIGSFIMVSAGLLFTISAFLGDMSFEEKMKMMVAAVIIITIIISMIGGLHGVFGA